HPLGDGRYLAASTDGVGSKLSLARRRGALRLCGADLAAHCINDVITTGAEPLFLMDYMAAGSVDLEELAELVEGAADVCRTAGGGILGNLERVLPEGRRAAIDWDAWERPSVFAWLARHVSEDELRRVFNLGIGFCAVVSDPGDALVIGRIE